MYWDIGLTRPDPIGGPFGVERIYVRQPLTFGPITPTTDVGKVVAEIRARQNWINDQGWAIVSVELCMPVEETTS